MKIVALKYGESVFGENHIFKGGNKDKCLPISFTIYLIQTESNNILVDVGCDDGAALRYSDEIKDIKNAVNVITTGGSGSLEEYIIHQIEMTEKLLDETPVSVKVENQGGQYICNVKFENNKNATMIYSSSLPFTVCIENDQGKSLYKKIESGFLCLIFIYHFDTQSEF